MYFTRQFSMYYAFGEKKQKTLTQSLLYSSFIHHYVYINPTSLNRRTRRQGLRVGYQFYQRGLQTRRVPCFLPEAVVEAEAEVVEAPGLWA